ncbi:histone deacetylase 1/2 [Rhizoctonia solani AG-1 IB]|uniref:histone deacetylase n=1 Tax=Thanatephorus cucumeris (strain AG1-IB / isolate 7/3/14) TaxID=1108050 RepID=A0A0B7FTP7_THACB|nr:histone deacetylase 1/2 [Rhizoctonia solani AG-1 IB]
MDEDVQLVSPSEHGSKRRVSYYYDGDVGLYSYGGAHPMKPYRMRMTHHLVAAYDMLQKMDVFRPRRATQLDMTRFHTDEYIDFLGKVSPETAEELTGNGTRFLVGEDNPAWDGLFEFCSISAGGSISAAQRLNSGTADIAVNWAGGLHHAKKREASGFCYVNDIVLGILELLRQFPRVLYIDIDCHHGDGVEEAFYTTDRVFTCSVHKQVNFFPGTGDVHDRGYGPGKGYTANIPLMNGISDEQYASIFQPVIRHIIEWYRPGAIVLQCGADSLSGDKLGVFNLSMEGHAACAQFVRSFNIPTILLGGGGYTTKNVARAWTYETACALGIEHEIPRMLPYTDHLEWYGPRYRLDVESSNMQNDNDTAYLEGVKRKVLEGLRELPFAPSVGLQDVPRMDVGEAIGLVDEEDEESEMDEVDLRLSHHVRNAHTVRSSSTSSSGEEQSYSSGDEAPESSRARHSRSGNTSSRVAPKRVFFRRENDIIWNSHLRSGPGAGTGVGATQHAWDDEDVDSSVRAVENSFVDLGMGRKRRYNVGIMDSWKSGPEDSP